MAKTPKKDDATLVAEYMEQLDHPLKPEMEALREIIKSADPDIRERIKWNAPSYYCGDDFLTFNHRMQDKVHLIFHHAAITSVQSPLLEGDYKDRRMAYFPDMAFVQQEQSELIRVIRTLLLGMKSR